MNSGSNPFPAPWWCRGAHAQTILGRFLRSCPPASFVCERFETPDGDFLDVDFLEGRPGGAGICLVIFHGLEGWSGAPYANSMAVHAAKRGWSVASVNFRGCSRRRNGLRSCAVPNRLAATYHSGKSEDAGFILNEIRKKKPARRFAAVGYSIGGNVLLKWLGEEGAAAENLLGAAAAVSVPYDLAASVERMDRGFNQHVYTRLLLDSLKRKALAKEREFPGLFDRGKVMKSRTFREFDREVTARLNGFRDEEEYWRKSSSAQYLPHVRLPTLLVHALDDPFFPSDLMPFGLIRRNPFLRPFFVEGGGHLGFVAGAVPWRQEPWLETRILDFFETVLSGLPSESLTDRNMDGLTRQGDETCDTLDSF